MNILSVKVENDLVNNGHYIDIKTVFIERVTKMKRIHVDKYHVYSGKDLILTLYVKPTKESVNNEL